MMRRAARIVQGGRPVAVEYFPFTGKQYFAYMLNEHGAQMLDEQEQSGDFAALFSTWPCCLLLPMIGMAGLNPDESETASFSSCHHLDV